MFFLFFIFNIFLNKNCCKINVKNYSVVYIYIKKIMYDSKHCFLNCMVGLTSEVRLFVGKGRLGRQIW